MGKGDIKTAKGKRANGSYGAKRAQKPRNESTKKTQQKVD